MAAFNKVNSAVEALAEKKINLGADTLKLAMTNTAPSAPGTTVLADITQITAANGYVSGGPTVTITSSAQTGGTYSLVGSDVTLTAAGGTIGPLRYVVLYSDTATNKDVLGWWDYGSSLTLQDTEVLTIDFGSSILTIA